MSNIIQFKKQISSDRMAEIFNQIADLVDELDFYDEFNYAVLTFDIGLEELKKEMLNHKDLTLEEIDLEEYE